MPRKIYEQEKEEETMTGGWQRGQLLGQGSSGSVHIAAPTEPRSERFKNFPKFMAVKSSWDSRGRADLEREKSLLIRLSDCPHVIRYLGSDETPLSLHLFIELATGGTLARLIDEASPVEERLVRRHTRSVLEGLKRIHDEGFVHCDLKPENILLVSGNRNDDDEEGEFGFTAKLADLGMAKRAQIERDGLRRSLKGTMIYLPPEAALFFIQEQASDVWALGCVVLKLFGGKLPWQHGNLSNSDIRNKIAMNRPVLPPGISKEARDFLGKCFMRNPGNRATVSELLTHPFLCETDKEEEEEGLDDDGYKNIPVVSENVMVSEEREQQRGCSSGALRAFGVKSLLQIQNIFCSFFS